MLLAVSDQPTNRPTDRLNASPAAAHPGTFSLSLPSHPPVPVVRAATAVRALDGEGAAKAGLTSDATGISNTSSDTRRFLYMTLSREEPYRRLSPVVFPLSIRIHAFYSAPRVQEN